MVAERKNDTWSLGDGRWVLYTEDPETAAAARKQRLSLMGEYMRRDGWIFAWQFAGPKEVVCKLAQRKKAEIS